MFDAEYTRTKGRTIWFFLKSVLFARVIKTLSEMAVGSERDPAMLSNEFGSVNL